MSVEELYEQTDEKIVDEMYADEKEVNEDEEFTKEKESVWKLEPIPLDKIDRKKVWSSVEIYAGHPCPVLVSAGSLPMIHPRDADFKPQKNIVNTSCVEYYDETLQKLYEWLAQYGDSYHQVKPIDEEEEVETPEYQVPRAVMGLAKLVDDARENLNEIWSPTMFTKKKKMRLLRDRKNIFLRGGADQVAIAIVQHINSLIRLGHYPQAMFGDYLKHSMNVKHTDGESKIVPLLDLILCAEVVMPNQEELIPKKRIDTALPSAGAG